MTTPAPKESRTESSSNIKNDDSFTLEQLMTGEAEKDSNDGQQSQRSLYYEAVEHMEDNSSENQKDDIDTSIRSDAEFEGGFRRRHRAKLQEKRSTFSRFRLSCGKLVNNEIVQIGMIVLIIINAIIMGVATFDFVTDNPDTEELFSNIDRGFLVIYTIELIMQFIYFGWRLIQDPWLVFDLFVVVISWAFDFNESVGNQFQIIRAFRIFRAFRLVTRIKVLRDLVAAIGEVIPRMTAIAMLLVLIFYIFAVLFTELFKDLVLSETYFTSLDASMLTCYEMMTLEWAGIARETMAQRSWAWAPFLAFIAITGFMVFNLIIAVICDAVSIIDKVAREREARALGIVLETPEQQLEHAQDRMDVLCERVDKMLRIQQDLQDILETLASELYKMDSSLPDSFSKDLNGARSPLPSTARNRGRSRRRIRRHSKSPTSVPRHSQSPAPRSILHSRSPTRVHAGPAPSTTDRSGTSQPVSAQPNNATWSDDAVQFGTRFGVVQTDGNPRI